MLNLLSFVWSLSIILESLPISSSGHLKLIFNFYENLYRKKFYISDFVFDLMHLPNFIILLFFVFQKKSYLLFDFNKNLSEIAFLIIASFITSLITAIFYFFIKLKKIYFPLYLGFIITSLLLLSLYFVLPGTNEITIVQSIVIGITQGLALLPGISRMASTYVVARWIGLNAQSSFIFSCVIELPILFAAILRAYFKESIKKIITKNLIILILISMIISYFLLVILYNALDLSFIYLGYYMLLPIFLSLFFKSLNNNT